MIAPTDDIARSLAERISAKTEAVVSTDPRLTTLDAMAGPEDLVVVPVQRSVNGLRSMRRLSERGWTLMVPARRRAASVLAAESPIGVAGRAID